MVDVAFKVWGVWVLPSGPFGGFVDASSGFFRAHRVHWVYIFFFSWGGGGAVEGLGLEAVMFPLILTALTRD